MDVVSLILAVTATGIVAGLLAGLLGVGGGIVIVPVLELVLGAIGVDTAVRMHVAVGTSLATIIPTSLFSASAHSHRNAIDNSVTQRWTPWIVVGTIAGAVIAGQVGANVLYLVFGVVALLVAVKMMLPLDDKVLANDVPGGALGALMPATIGGLSAMMGIGGGTMSVPLLTLYGRGVHIAVGTSAYLGAVIAMPATLGFVYSGWGNAELPPWSLGYVNVVGFLLIIPATMIFAPIGARIAHRLPKRALSMMFGAFLLIVAIRMLVKVAV